MTTTILMRAVRLLDRSGVDRVARRHLLETAYFEGWHLSYQPALAAVETELA